MQQLGRSAIIQIGKLNESGLQISGLRVHFTVKKTSTTDYNTAKLAIYNLNPNNRNRIRISGDELLKNSLGEQYSNDLLIIKAGYTENECVVFMGNITLTNTQINRPDVITNVEASDGINGMNDLKYTQSYSAGVSAKKVLQDIVSKSAFAKNAINWNSLPDKRYPQGFTFHGFASVALSSVCNFIGLEWSIQNSELKFIPEGGNDGIRVASINSSNGMIGSPEELADISNSYYTKADKRLNSQTVMTVNGAQKKKRILGGLKVKTLLRPEINPGNVVEIESQEIKRSLYRVVEVLHEGDTHDINWQTELTTIVV